MYLNIVASAVRGEVFRLLLSPHKQRISWGGDVSSRITPQHRTRRWIKVARDGRRYTILQPSHTYPVWNRKIPYYVPNGMWVWEANYSGASIEFIGPGAANVRRVKLDRSPRGYKCIYVSSEPFGLLIGGYEGSDDRRFFYARQICKGELGRSPSGDPKLEIAREAPDLSRKMHNFPRGRSQKRNHICWARLTDVVEASSLSAEALLLSYWPFIGKSFDCSTDRYDTLLHVVAAPLKLIKTGRPRVLFLDQDGVREMLTGSIDDVWIRAGFAKTILRLQALGYPPAAVEATA